MDILAQSGNQPDSFPVIQHAVPYQPKLVTIKCCVLPTGIIATGALRLSGEVYFADPEVKEERDEHFRTFHTGIDNYLQFAPIAAGYTMLINNKRHCFWKYIKKVVVTEVVLNALAQSVKRITKVPRPDTGESTSFLQGIGQRSLQAQSYFVMNLHSIIPGFR